MTPKPGIPLNEPQTATGRADHDRAWRKGDDSPVDHAQSRDGCEGCAFIARVEREAQGIPLIDVELLRKALRRVLDEFDSWASEPRPAIDGGMVRIYRFREVQPAMERVLADARLRLDDTDRAVLTSAGEPYR